MIMFHIYVCTGIGQKFNKPASLALNSFFALPLLLFTSIYYLFAASILNPQSNMNHRTFVYPKQITSSRVSIAKLLA